MRAYFQNMMFTRMSDFIYSYYLNVKNLYIRNDDNKGKETEIIWAISWVKVIYPRLKNKLFKKIELNSTMGKKNKFVVIKPSNCFAIDLLAPGKTK